MLKASGFKKIEILFFQRYGFNNHLGWFVENRPGGHSFFNNIVDRKMDHEYKSFLIRKKKDRHFNCYSELKFQIYIINFI